MSNTITYTIVKSIAVLSTSKKGWTKEANMISWNGAPAKLDIRDWAPNHEKMGKGIVLSQDEVVALLTALDGNQPAKEPAPQQASSEPEPVAQPQPQPTAEPVNSQGYSSAMLAQIAAAQAMLNKNRD